MMLTLKRDTVAPDCVLGTLTIGDSHKLYTIEKPFVPNAHGGKAGAPFISCLPAGVFRLEPHKLPSGERVYIVSNSALDVFQMPYEVPKSRNGACRSRVTIRAANYAFEAIDSIGVGTERVKTKLGWKLERSLDAMNQVRTILGSTFDLQLVIEDSGGATG